MAPSSQCGKSPCTSKSPQAARSGRSGCSASPQAEAAGAGAGSALFALLLNCETKDEGEELLDYCFPPDDQELQHIAQMKGVFIASCGVMRAAVGEEAMMFVFWAEDGSRQYKASMRRIERWIACIVLPGSASDRTAQFFADEAAGLVALRHGKLSSLQGHFRQLDRIFKALGSMWSESLQGGDEAGCCSSQLYASLGMVPWSPHADSWEKEVRQKVCDWEARWQATAQDPSLANPEGFALFLGQTLIGTSLHDRAFEACLRLCVLEGVLEPDRSGVCQDDGSCDVRCHSLFLQREEAGAAVLPSHQYSVLRHGPWLLFMLWQMASADAIPGGGVPSAPVAEGISPKTPAKALLQGSDPFGVDLCLDLLSGLSLPPAYAKASPSAAASPSKPRHPTPRGSGGAGRSRFALPCPAVFKPGARRAKPPRQPVETEAVAAVRPPEQTPSVCALELEEPPCTTELPSAASSFTSMRRPRCSARDRIPELSRLLCPEMAQRVAGRRRCEAMPWAPRELVCEWSELEWLMQVHAQRRADWREAPSPGLTKHALLSVLKSGGDFDRLWNECLEESSLAEPAKARRSEASKLGDGQPWRFQVGAPFHLSDVAPLVGAGVLTGCGHCKAWAAMSMLSSGERQTDAGTQRVLLQMDAADEPL